MKLAPDRTQPPVVLAPAQRACAVAGGERRRVVEEEELGEAPGLEQRSAMPAAEPEPARDPPLPVVAAADASIVVVQAAAVAVDETARGIGNQVAQWCDAVLQRHRHPAYGRSRAASPSWLHCGQHGPDTRSTGTRTSTAPGRG